MLVPSPFPSPLRDCVVMSLRGSEATEAISQGIDISEIATLPAVARNDRKGIMTQSLRGEGRVRRSYKEYYRIELRLKGDG